MQREKKSKSKEKLERAFFDLLEEKHYSKISVSQLIKKADVSRTTFYRHYTDIFDMYSKTCERLLMVIVREFGSDFLQSEKGLLSASFEKFYIGLASQQRYIFLLSGKNGDRTFYETGMTIVFNFVDDYMGILTEDERFALKFVVLSAIGNYVKSELCGHRFPIEFLEYSKTLLDEVQVSKGGC